MKMLPHKYWFAMEGWQLISYSRIKSPHHIFLSESSTGIWVTMLTGICMWTNVCNTCWHYRYHCTLSTFIINGLFPQSETFVRLYSSIFPHHLNFSEVLSMISVDFTGNHSGWVSIWDQQCVCYNDSGDRSLIFIFIFLSQCKKSH